MGADPGGVCGVVFEHAFLMRDQVEEAKRLRALGLRFKEIAAELRCSVSWAHVLVARGGKPWRSHG